MTLTNVLSCQPCWQLESESSRACVSQGFLLSRILQEPVFLTDDSTELLGHPITNHQWHITNHLKWSSKQVSRWICIALKPFISKALRYGLSVTMGSHKFTCHPHTNHTCLYSSATGVTIFWLVLTGMKEHVRGWLWRNDI